MMAAAPGAGYHPAGVTAKVSVLPPIVRTSAGHGHNMAIGEDGTLWAWGENHLGQLGLSDTANRYTPTRVGTNADWVHVSAGRGTHTLGIRKDSSGNRTLWAWGYNQNGQLGLGDTEDRNTPTRVGTYTDWVHVSAGGTHTMGIREDGEGTRTLWAWGDNLTNQLGLGDTAAYSTPTRVMFDTSGWQTVSAGSQHTLAVREDSAGPRTLWVWGRGSGLGLGDTAIRTTPTQVMP